MKVIVSWGKAVCDGTDALALWALRLDCGLRPRADQGALAFRCAVDDGSYESIRGPVAVAGAIRRDHAVTRATCSARLEFSGELGDNVKSPGRGFQQYLGKGRLDWVHRSA